MHSVASDCLSSERSRSALRRLPDGHVALFAGGVVDASAGESVQLFREMIFKNTYMSGGFGQDPFGYINCGLGYSSFKQIKNIHYWRGSGGPMDRPWFKPV